MYLSGALADLTGFSTTFLILLGINLLLLFLIPTVFRQKKEARKAA
jgi:LPXTG-motif cell wall-anchored protein